MKKLIALSTAVAIMASMGYAAESDLEAQVQTLEKEVAKLKKKMTKNKKNISKVKRLAASDNLKWDVDYRVTWDALNYKHADGDTREKNDLFSNRLWLGMKYAPRNDISFIGQLAYYKNFGDTANHMQSNSAFGVGYANFDWVTNENATDNTLKVRVLYAIYFGDKLFGANMPWTFSAGRRPSTNGLMINYRDDDPASSPNGHSINTEFDGYSLKLDFDKLTGIPGMHLKFCGGKGLTNATPRFNFTYQGADYVSDKSKNPDIYMQGFIFVPYDDGQYSIHTQYFYAWDLIGFHNQDMWNYGLTTMGYDPSTFDPTNMQVMTGGSGNQYIVPQSAYTQYDNAAILPSAQQAYAPQFDNFGGMHGMTVSAIANGIGNGWSDFTDDLVLFASYSGSLTDPKEGKNMLGSPDQKYGWSAYVGANFPAMFVDGGRFGLEYNHGSQYWRSMTYAEDTMIGSKLAARGDAFEAYYTQQILDRTISFQLRYTYIDYKYTGSNSFFGEDGTPVEISSFDATDFMFGNNPVDKAQDIRAYLRYRF